MLILLTLMIKVVLELAIEHHRAVVIKIVTQIRNTFLTRRLMKARAQERFFPEHER